MRQTGTELKYLANSDKPDNLQLCNLPVTFVMITQFIQHVTENMDNLDSRNGRHERNVWEMHTDFLEKPMEDGR